MLKRTSDFTHHVWEAADRVGLSAPRIVDGILKSIFPNTTDAAETEGAARMLRNGCIAEVKRVLHSPRDSTGQSDFGEVDASFLPLIRQLQRPSYFVPERDEEVFVEELIADPAQLDGARRFMRRKGMECLAEAERLDRLYDAVVRRADVAASGAPALPIVPPTDRPGPLSPSEVA